VVGVKLAQELLQLSGKKGWKVYLLGGLSGTAKKLAGKYKSVIGYDEGYNNIKIQKTNSQINDEIVNKINKLMPDILLVGLGRFEQEKWIAKNLKSLKAKVVMGVGSGFDELAGIGPWAAHAPEWVDRMGLKWLWRAVKDPKHIRRAWNAFPVFAWKVFRSR
jgi:N-acetylglucosaminyldiphosphoundecaprenol N-acetyl-beta-D-mannosaminyltransferase